MKRFFRQALDIQVNGSNAHLDGQRNLIRNDQAAGLIEIEISPTDLIVILFTEGEVAASYRLSTGSILSIPTSKIGFGWENKEVPIRTVLLGGHAGRAIQQVLESEPHNHQQIRSEGEWNKLLETCREDKLTGLIEVASDSHDGFIFLHQGLPVKTDSIFSSAQGFRANPLLSPDSFDNPWQIKLYRAVLASPVYQRTLLRHCMNIFSKNLLTRYQNMVGQRMLQFLNANINAYITPWQMDIRLAGTGITDQHFFPQLQHAADAYREIFMAIGEEFDLVLGSALAQRIFGESFRQLDDEEHVLLEALRLIPAAFLN